MQQREVMKMRDKAIAFLLVFILGIGSVSAQTPGKVTRQSALDSFTNGDFEKAYTEFSGLLASYPRDPSYKYYSAVCLIKLNRKPETARNLLEQAMTVQMRTIPDDAGFYLGRANQQLGEYQKAIQYYKDFGGKAGRKKARELNVDEYINECRNQTGKINESPAGAAEKLIVAENVKTDDSQAKTGTIKPAERVPEDVDKKMGESLDKQITADSIKATVNSKGGNEQKPVGQMEKGQVISTMQTNTGSDQAMNKPEQQKQTDTSAQKEVVKKDNAVQISAPIQKDTETVKAGVTLKPAGIYSVFEILPQPVKDPKEKIEINPSVPDGLIYRIQMGVFRNPVSTAFFKGITP
ncbi:MAG TPA: tetratricopeptide repeat protein, partial [Bacteroidales bacterium]|nr:tetratricopeptide repeat protein [Bacteroidales bacterium]